MTNNNNQRDSNGWTQYQKLVLSELERHETQFRETHRDITEFKLAQTRMALEITNLVTLVTTVQVAITKEAIELKTAKDELKSLKTKIMLLAIGMGLLGGSAIPALAPILHLVLKLFIGH